MKARRPGPPGVAAYGVALDALGSGFSTAFRGAWRRSRGRLTVFGMLGLPTRRPARTEAPPAPAPWDPDARSPESAA